MREDIIPRRPDNDSDFRLTKIEKDTLLVKYLLGYTNASAFALFNPHYCDNTGGLNKAGKTACRQFFTHPKNVEWLESYEATLLRHVKGVAKDSGGATAIDDTRKDKALKSLLSQAMSLVESDSDLDADSLKTISEIFKKIGLLKDEEEQVEGARRYLPVRCSECDYRAFVESHVNAGEIENTCLRCKALDVAKEHGFRYDPKCLLRGENSDISTESNNIT